MLPVAVLSVETVSSDPNCTGRRSHQVIVHKAAVATSAQEAECCAPVHSPTVGDYLGIPPAFRLGGMAAK
ncbi:MAG: hypothetical protein FRX49_01117 [Trebouxia sp. A1-2]|nr:MAG: hypothetical protein FRX49_01117 [Trebouxia sp. A1-2]